MVKLLKQMGLTILVFVCTYILTVLCLFMFKTEQEIESLLISSIAPTTITYSLSIILCNLFSVKGHILYFNVISICAVAAYIMVYVAVCNGQFPTIVFWYTTLSVLFFSFVSEIEKNLFALNTAKKKNIYFIFSA